MVNQTRGLSTAWLLVLVSIAGGIGLCAGISGCRHLDYQPEYFPPPQVAGEMNAAAASAVRRIVVLPAENQTRYREIPRQFGQRISAALQATPEFEVVQVDRLLAPPCPLSHIERGDYPMQLLVDMYRHYNADAVLFTRVDHYHPYDPMALGVTTILVDTREATVVAWASGHWAMSDHDVNASYRCYVQHRPDGGLDQSVLMRSPDTFRQYVADLIVHHWLP